MGDRADGYMTAPDNRISKMPSEEMFTRAVEDQRVRNRNIRYGAAGAAGAAAVGGLASLIGGERDRREQEQYQ